MVIVFVPFLVATVGLILVHRRTRRRGEDLPLGAAIGTGVILALVAVEVALVVVFVVAGAVTSSLT